MAAPTAQEMTGKANNAAHHFKMVMAAEKRLEKAQHALITSLLGLTHEEFEQYVAHTEAWRKEQDER